MKPSKLTLLLVLVLGISLGSSATAEEAGTLLAWKYEPGQTLRYQCVEQTHRAILDEERLISTETLVWRQTVKAADPDSGEVILDLKCESWSREDLAGSADSEHTFQGRFDMLRHVLCALTQGELSMSTQADGGINELKGVDTLHRRVTSIGRRMTETRKLAEGFQEGFNLGILEQLLNDWAIQRLLPQQFAELLTEPIEPGHNWSVGNCVYQLSHLPHRLRYKLDSIDEKGVAQVSLTCRTDTPEEDEPTAGDPAEQKTGIASGQMTFDSQAGRLVNLKLDMSFPGNLITFRRSLEFTQLEDAPEPAPEKEEPATQPGKKK